MPCRADAPVMAGVILYIVTRTWCKICRCVDAWGGSRFALRLTLSRQPLPPTLAPLWRHSCWARGTGRSDRAPFPGRIIPIGSSLSLEGGSGAKPREAGRTWLPREARSCAGTCVEKRIGAGPRRRALEWPSAHVWGEHGCISVMCVYDGEMKGPGSDRSTRRRRTGSRNRGRIFADSTLLWRVYHVHREGMRPYISIFGPVGRVILHV